MPLKISLKNAADFRKCVESISVLVDEAEFVADKEGFSLKATDPSQISMVDFSIPKKAFESFEVPSATKIGLDLDYLAQIMSRAKSGDSLQLELDEENSRLNIIFRGSNKRSFHIPLIDISQQELPTPKIEFDSGIKVNASSIQEGLKDASLISTHISLGISGESFEMSSKSSKGSFLNETTKKDEALSEITSKKDAKAMFPLDYLQNMLKAADSSTTVSLELKDNHPVKVSYQIGEATVSYYLAPRIEN